MDFFRKLCLKHEIWNKKLHVKLKTTVLASVAATVFFVSLFAIVYLLGFNMFRNRAIESQGEMSRILAAQIDSAIENQAELLKLNANSQFVIDALKENNLKYRAKSEKEIQFYLVDIDKKWIKASEDSVFLRDYLENKLSHRLSGLQLEKKELLAVTIADKFGGLVGSTIKPSKFYSFDQDWWLSSYAKGHGKFFIGNVEYDQASDLWCLPFAVPIEDEAGSVIGVYKALISLDTLFKPLLNFRIGNTGKVALVDDKAYLIYHNKALPFANKYCEYQEFQRTLQNRDRWGVLESAYLNRGKSLVTYSEISYPSLAGKGTKWFVFVENDLGEIFAPLNNFIFVVVLIGIVLIFILALFVFTVSGQKNLDYSMLQNDGNAQIVKTENKNQACILENDRGLQKDK